SPAPEGDYRQVEPRLQQVHGCGVAERVRGDAATAKCGAPADGGADRTTQSRFYARPRERGAAAIGEERRLQALVDPGQPRAEVRGGGLPKRDGPFLPTLAVEVNRRCCAEVQVADGEGDRFGDAGAGVVEGGEQNARASAPRG